MTIIIATARCGNATSCVKSANFCLVGRPLAHQSVKNQIKSNLLWSSAIQSQVPSETTATVQWPQQLLNSNKNNFLPHKRPVFDYALSCLALQHHLRHVKLQILRHCGWTWKLYAVEFVLCCLLVFHGSCCFRLSTVTIATASHNVNSTLKLLLLKWRRSNELSELCAYAYWWSFYLLLRLVCMKHLVLLLFFCTFSYISFLTIWCCFLTLR